MRFIFGCGGTGGHIYPALALAKKLGESGHQAFFVGHKSGMEASLIKSEGYPFHPIRVQKLSRKLSVSLLAFPFQLLGGIINCWKYIGFSRPDAVICTGGFVSGPVAIAAILCKIPLFFHESNSFPGLTTRYLAKYTSITFVSWQSTPDHLKKAPHKLTGIPLLPRKTDSGKLNPQELGLSMEKPIILITGGSQGSLAINQAIDAASKQMLDNGWQLVWQTGKTGYQQFAAKYHDTPGIYLFDFSPLLPLFYQFASLAITRAGAMTIAELEQSRLPAILIPLPSAAENHQFYNASEQQDKGLALCLQQKDLNPDTLITNIEKILKHRQSYLDSFQMVPPNTAADDISKAILDYLQKEETNVR